MKPIVLVVYTPGDPSVGIAGDRVEVSFGEWDPTDGDREERRRLEIEVVEALANYFDGKPRVFWTDQCDICGSIGGGHYARCPDGPDPICGNLRDDP